MEITQEFISLHTHWLHADAIKVRVSAGTKRPEKPEDMLKDIKASAEAYSMMKAIQVYYALLYVVIEGYRELGYEDERLDQALSDEEKVGALRRLRNAMFHFQKNPLNEKLLGFLTAENSEHWIRELNEAFDQFFSKLLPIEEMKELIKVAETKANQTSVKEDKA